MRIAVEKEQLKAVVRLAMISVLEEDVYGHPGSDVYGACAEYTGDAAAGSPNGIASRAGRPRRPTAAACILSD